MSITKTASAALCALTLAAAPALAGGLAEPIEMAPVEIIEDTAGGSSNAGLIIPLILIALIVAAMQSSGGDSGGTEPPLDLPDLSPQV